MSNGDLLQQKKDPRIFSVFQHRHWFQLLTVFSCCRVTAEVKHNSTNTIVCKAQGEWNGTLEFTYSSGDTKVIDTDKLPVTKKKLRPVERQGRTESRWSLPIRRRVLERRAWRTGLNGLSSMCVFPGGYGSASPNP